MQKQSVGLLTFHGAHNFGSVLQTYASCKVLQNMGYEVEVINMRNQAQKDAYRIFKPFRLTVGSFIRNAFIAMNYCSFRKRANNFERFINNVLPTTDREFIDGADVKAHAKKYDIYYTGSDQVWNPACQDFESAYYLDFTTPESRRVAYAPSLGKGKFDKADQELIKGLLNNVDFISCREKEGAALLRALTDKPVAHVCDPVVLLERKYWEEIAVAPKTQVPYILTYFLENNHGDRSQVENIRKQTGYKVIALNEYIRDWVNPHIHLCLGCSPEEFVGFIKNASLVLTNSFHCTAFSVIFQRKFFTCMAASENVANNNDSRKVDFLKSIGLESRLLPNGSVPDLSQDIDYDNVQPLLDAFRKESSEYLINAVTQPIER